MRTYWKHNVAEDMQVVEYTAEQKAMFPSVTVVFVFLKHHLSLRFASSSAQLFLRVWLISQQGINLSNGLRGHLGQNLQGRGKDGDQFKVVLHTK